MLLCMEEGSSPVSSITERRNMDLYEVPFSVSVRFGDGDYVSQLPYVKYYVVVKTKNSFKQTREECESKRAYVF